MWDFHVIAIAHPVLQHKGEIHEGSRVFRGPPDLDAAPFHHAKYHIIWDHWPAFGDGKTTWLTNGKWKKGSETWKIKEQKNMLKTGNHQPDITRHFQLPQLVLQPGLLEFVGTVGPASRRMGGPHQRQALPDPGAVCWLHMDQLKGPTWIHVCWSPNRV